MRRVVITGMGMVAATGHNVNDCWNAAVEAKSGIDKITLFDASGLPVQIAGEVKNLQTDHALDPKEARRSTRFVALAAVAAKEAIDGSGLNLTGNTDRYGCAIGVGIGALNDIEQNTLILKEKGPKRVSPFFIPYTIANMAAGIVSIMAMSAYRTVTQRPVSRAIIRAALRAAPSFASSSTMMLLPILWNEAGLETHTRIGGRCGP